MRERDDGVIPDKDAHTGHPSTSNIAMPLSESSGEPEDGGCGQEFELRRRQVPTSDLIRQFPVD